MVAAAVKAHHLEKVEEEEIKRLLPQLLDLHLHKINLKRQQFCAFEAAMEKEKESLETRYKELLNDKQALNETLGVSPIQTNSGPLSSQGLM